MSFHKTIKILAALLGVLALPAQAASITQVLPSYTAGHYAIKNSDGDLLYWGSSGYASSNLGFASTCNDPPMGSNFCVWHVMSASQARASTSLMGSGAVTSTTILGAFATVDRIVSASTTGTNGIAWYLAGGKLYSVKSSFSASAASFAGVVPSGDSVPLDIAALNGLGTITDSVVDENGTGVMGVYAVTSSGDLYYYGKKPVYVQVSPDAIANDAVAATTPVKIASNISRIFASRTGGDNKWKLGVVDASGTAWVYQVAAGSSPVNISTTQGIGTVSKVTYSNSGDGPTTILVSGNGVFAELQTNYGSALTSAGVSTTASDYHFYPVANISPADVNGDFAIVGGYGGTVVMYATPDGTPMGFGGMGSAANPLGSPSLAARPVLLTDAAWHATVVATMDTVAGKVNLTITPPTGAGDLRVYRAASASANGTLLQTLTGTSTSYQDTPPDGNSYWYYVVADTTDGKAGPQSSAAQGRANVAPTAVGGTASVVNGASTPITVAITDPNTGDTFTLAVTVAPNHGTATVTNNQITYQGTDAIFAGTDAFTVSATDQLGNTKTGTVNVSVSCSAPSITGQTQDPLVSWGQGTIQVNYNSQQCHTNLTAKLDVLDPLTGSVVVSNTTPMLAVGNNQTLNFVLKDLVAKNYPARVTFQSDQLAPVASNITAISVASTTDPVLTNPKSTYSEDELVAITLAMPVDSNCPFTADPVVAQANSSYCYAEAIQIPLGLSQETTPGQLKISGYGAPMTNTPFQYQVSKWDSLGNKHVVKSNVVTLSFLEAPTPVFGMFVTNTNITAIKDMVAADLRQTSGATCPVYTDSTAAQADLAKGKRACLAAFTTPAGAIMQYDSTAKRFSGRFKVGITGQQSLGYQVQRLYMDKAAVGVAEGTLNFNVTDFTGAPTFGVTLNKGQVVRGVDTVVATVTQLSGEPCTLTSSASDATASWYVDGMPKCLVTWGTLPGSMAATGLSATGKITDPGTFPVPANISIINPSSGAEVSLDVQSSLQAVLPDGPPFAFDGTPVLPGTNLYAVGVGGALGKITVTDDSLGNVSMSIDTGGAAPEIYRGLKKGGIRNLTVTPGALWSTKDIVVTTLWEDFPDVKSTLSIRSVVLPPSGMQTSMLIPPTIVSTLPVNFAVAVGLSGNTGMRFDAGQMGVWKGHLGALQADGSVSNLTDPVIITNGKATLTYPRAGDISNAQIVFIAEVQSGLDGYTSKLVSKPSKILVVDGAGINSTLKVDTSSGAAPLRVKLTATISTDQAKVLGASAWLVSNDGGATWAAIEHANGTAINYVFKDAGKYLVKSKLTNRFSGEIAYSDPVSIAVYALPALTVDGKTVVLVGTTAALKATSQATSVKWQVENLDGTKRTVQGADLALDSAMPQVINATAMASSETGDYLNDPAAWATQKAGIRFINLTPLKISLSGPKNLEVGVEGQFDAVLKTDWDNAAAGFVLIGQWTLPDGSSVAGLSLKWTPTADNFASNKVPVFSAWVTGYTDQTMASVVPKIVLKKYVWPDWVFQTKYDVLQAPALIRISVGAPADQIKLFSSVGEKIKYTWALPANATDARATGGSTSFTAEMPGDYAVQVKLEDSRGNVKVLDTTITVTEPIPMEVNFKTTASNSFLRVPLTINLKPQFYKGHPKERITTYRFYQDGQLLGENNKGVYTVVENQEGDYLFAVEADTTLGRTVKASTTVTVVANKPPVCNLVSKPYKTTATVTAECKDPDGRISSYGWKVDGQPVSTTGYRVVVPLGVAVEVTVTDDSGAAVVYSGTP